jgi:hypothetical protein
MAPVQIKTINIKNPFLKLMANSKTIKNTIKNSKYPNPVINRMKEVKLSVAKD